MEQQAVIDFFDQAAAGWDAQLVRNEAVIGQILDNAGIRPGVSVLDVACGTGVLIPDYLKRGAAQITAIDIAPEMVRIAREKFPQENVTVLCGDASQAHFPALFDCIVIYNAFPHFPEPERLIAHLAELLTTGGTLTVAHGFSRKALDAHHAKTARSVSQRPAASRNAGRNFCKTPDRHRTDFQRCHVSGCGNALNQFGSALFPFPLQNNHVFLLLRGICRSINIEFLRLHKCTAEFFCIRQRQRNALQRIDHVINHPAKQCVKFLIVCHKKFLQLPVFG